MSYKFFFLFILLLGISVSAQTLTTPVVTSPQNGSAGNPQSLTVTWNAVSGAASYKVRVGTDAQLYNAIFNDTNYTGTSCSLNSLVPGNTYYIKVKAKNSTSSSAWSGVCSFSVSYQSVTTLPVPGAVFPANNSTGIGNALVVMVWSQIPDALTYSFILAKDQAFTNVVAQQSNAPATSFALLNTLATGTTYYWKIKAIQNAVQSNWSPVYTFTTYGSGSGSGSGSGGGTATLSAPGIISPGNNSVNQNISPVLNWSLVYNASAYNVKVASDASLNNVVFSASNVTATTINPSGLSYNTVYYWSVQSVSGTTQSSWSPVCSFKTGLQNQSANTTHPRLWITVNDTARLRSWANSSNPVYQNGIVPALNQAVYEYNSKFFPGGTANSNWPDYGTTGWEMYCTEAYAEFFAFNAVIDPNPAKRIQYAQYARNLLMYVINEAAKGYQANTAFRDPMFALFNRSNYWGEAFGLTVDWIYNIKDGNGNYILSSRDKATIRQVFLMWSQSCLNAYVSGGDRPFPVGAANDPALLNGFRTAGNNYYTGHMRHLTLMSLSFDPQDDAPVNPSLPASALGNTVRSYTDNVIGSWLYQQYAFYESPSIVKTDYNLQSVKKDMGLGSGGLSVEGPLYGHSIGYLSEALLALHTAGCNNPSVYGPQVKLISGSYFDKFLDGMLHSVTPTATIDPNNSYLGPLYQPASYGDILRFWVIPDYIQSFGPIGIYNYLTQNTSRLNKGRWMAKNLIEGGAQLFLNRVSNIWGNSNATDAILYYMMFDPTAANSVPDPRPALPTTFFDPAMNRVLSRTDWTNNSSWFNYMCRWTTINHQNGDGGQFELYRKGEWLIKEVSGYNMNDMAGASSEFHNTLAIQNTVPGNLLGFETETSARGGQWTNGMNAGDPTTLTSLHPEFIFAQSDMTNLYNRPNQWTVSNSAVDVAHASRSILWLKPDRIFVYDRASSKSQNMFKRTFLSLGAYPQINGKNATATFPSGQKLMVSSLLPANATVSVNPNQNYNSLAAFQPTTHGLKFEDPSNPQSTRFLNVIQANDAGTTFTQPALYSSTSGTAYDAAVLEGTAVLFPVALNNAVVQSSILLPQGLTQKIITGLQPNALYDVTVTSVNGMEQMTVQAGTTYTADNAGVVYITSPVLGKQATSGGTPARNFAFSLAQNYPNPFNPVTEISYSIPSDGIVTLKLYDVLGKEIREIESGYKVAGEYKVQLNASGLATGLYFYELTAGSHREMKKMIVLK